MRIAEYKIQQDGENVLFFIGDQRTGNLDCVNMCEHIGISELAGEEDHITPVFTLFVNGLNLFQLFIDILKKNAAKVFICDRTSDHIH